MLDITQQQLEREINGQVHFSDVFPENTSPDDATWWRRTEFDTPLTAQSESNPDGIEGMHFIPIGERPWLASYGLVLLDDLVGDRRARIAGMPDINHPDTQAEKASLGSALITLVNKAPRDEVHVAYGANGSDFYCGITHNGLEIYATPPSFLASLESRNRLRALYRIPTEDHPEFREGEQFRSARVVRSRRHPEHMERVFDYSSFGDLAEAKQTGKHPDVIPENDRVGKIAFVDRFGNVILESSVVEQIHKAGVDDTLTLEVDNNGNQTELPVTVVRNLASAPLGKLAVYQNCSSQQDEASVGLVELVARVDDNPAVSSSTAMFILQQEAGVIDVENAILHFF